MDTTFVVDSTVLLVLEALCLDCERAEPLPCDSPQSWEFADIHAPTVDYVVHRIVTDCVLNTDHITVSPRFFGVDSRDDAVVDSSFLGVDGDGMAWWSVIVVYELDTEAFPTAISSCCKGSFTIEGMITLKFSTPATEGILAGR